MIADPPAPLSPLILGLERRLARSAPADLVDLAVLRRALPRLPDRPDPRALAIVAGYCGSSYAAQDAGMLTAALWSVRHRAAAPMPSGWNLGRALRALPREEGERIWRGLCTADQGALTRRMAGAMDALAGCAVPADWHRLHRDLRSWHQGFHHTVLRRWCTGLFGPAAADPPCDPQIPTTSEVLP
jgi:hypothetical protein